MRADDASWLERRRRSLAASLESYSERPFLIQRLLRRPRALLEARRPIPGLRLLGFVVCSACVTYWLAAIFNVGVHGLEWSGALDNSNTFPTANGVFVLAYPVYALGLGFAYFGSARGLEQTVVRGRIKLFLLANLAAGCVGLVMVAILV